MKRIFLIVLDSVGAGALPDAAAYGDAGANTLGHIIEKAHPHLPNMEAMGLGLINKFLEGWTGAVLAKIFVLVFVVIFIQKRPQGLFAMKGRSAEA